MPYQDCEPFAYLCEREFADPTECDWCGGDLSNETEADEAFFARCYDCDATVENDYGNYLWTPSVRTVVELARQVIQDDVWPHLSAEIRREICDALADDVRIARKAVAS